MFFIIIMHFGMRDIIYLFMLFFVLHSSVLKFILSLSRFDSSSFACHRRSLSSFFLNSFFPHWPRVCTCPIPRCATSIHYTVKSSSH
jgi:hypothetical protein